MEATRVCNRSFEFSIMCSKIQEKLAGFDELFKTASL